MAMPASLAERPDAGSRAHHRRKTGPATKVAHLITGLETGGAERLLARLVARTDRARFESIVISMTGPGTIGPLIEASGVRVHTLGMRRGIADPRAVLRLRRILADYRPAVLQTWMYHADLLGLLARGLGWAPHLVWCVVCTESVGTSVVRRLLGWGSARPDAVVSVSRAGQRLHEALGYRPRRWAYIPTGFDTERLVPDPALRRRQRAALGLGDAVVAIAIPARYHPMKDHATFLAAAGRLAPRLREARFVLIGKGSEPGNRELCEQIERHALGERVVLLGERGDIDALYGTFDIVTLSSAYGEGFPLVLGEAMSCGVPCVATDVGDCGAVIGDPAAVVPPRDPAALADAWERLARLPAAARAAQGAAARARIVEHFRLDSVVARYEALYDEITRG